MFFRNALVAHKNPVKPYFTLLVVQQALIGCSNRIKIAQKPRKIKCLRLEGSNFRLGGIAPITRAVPSFQVPMRPVVSVARQKGN